MDWRGRRRHTRARNPATRLADEAEAFLIGRYTETGDPGAGWPAWARLNWISHAAPEEVVARVGDPGRPLGRLGSWEWAVGALSEELVSIAGGQTPVIDVLQRGCLVPLELTLMQPAFWSVLPAEVVALALTRLRAHPPVRRHGLRGPPPEEA